MTGHQCLRGDGRRAAALLYAVAFLLLGGCGPKVRMTALISMMPDQEKYFREEVVPVFEKENRVAVETVHYGSIDSVDDYVRKHAGTAGIVKVPFDRSTMLIERGLLKPLDAICTPAELARFRNDYLLTNLGKVGGRPYLVPRKFETRIMVYCKSKVRDALDLWRTYKDEIDSEMKRYNGYGLPSDYYLEEDPNEWDYFDFFVAGWIWSHTRYRGKAIGRIGLRGKRYSGTWLGIVDRVFQLDGDSAAVVSMTGDAVLDAFHWEAVYAASGVYNPGMWEQGWSGSDIWKAFAGGEVFLSFMTQLDCFFLHGTGRDNLDGYFKDPDDMGVALMPKACSLELSDIRVPLRSGKRSITTGGWWWGIPAATPDSMMSYRLARHITSTPSQIQECTRFGMIPVRKDVLSDMNMLFGGGWISRVYDVSFRQLMQNGTTALPSHPQLDKIGEIYLDAWYTIVAKKKWSADSITPQRSFIGKLLTSIYSLRAQRLLNGGSPQQ
ncbi:MAG: extracellular solute-binding protein [Chitinispirillaceae bacterium]|nr:extracellular solute-binding protein [Chitinispirillaceae bacterium]